MTTQAPTALPTTADRNFIRCVDFKIEIEGLRGRLAVASYEVKT